MILNAYPARGVVIGSSLLDSHGNKLLPPHFPLFTRPVPVNFHMIYNATLRTACHGEGISIAQMTGVLSVSYCSVRRNYLQHMRKPFSILQYLICLRHLSFKPVFPRFPGMSFYLSFLRKP